MGSILGPNHVIAKAKIVYMRDIHGMSTVECFCPKQEQRITLHFKSRVVQSIVFYLQ